MADVVMTEAGVLRWSLHPLASILSRKEKEKEKKAMAEKRNDTSGRR